MSEAFREENNNVVSNWSTRGASTKLDQVLDLIRGDEGLSTSEKNYEIQSLRSRYYASLAQVEEGGADLDGDLSPSRNQAEYSNQGQELSPSQRYAKDIVQLSASQQEWRQANNKSKFVVSQQSSFHQDRSRWTDHEKLLQKQGYFNVNRSSAPTFGTAGRFQNMQPLRDTRHSSPPNSRNTTGGRMADNGKIGQQSTNMFDGVDPSHIDPYGDFSRISGSPGVSFSKSSRQLAAYDKPHTKAEEKQRINTVVGPGRYTLDSAGQYLAPKVHGGAWGKSAKTSATLMQATRGATKQETHTKYRDALVTKGYTKSFKPAPGPGQYEECPTTKLSKFGNQRTLGTFSKAKRLVSAQSRKGSPSDPNNTTGYVPGPAYYTPLWGA